MLEFKKHSGIFLLFLTTAFISFAISAFAEDFYWENPSLITSKDSRFPLVLNGESESYIIYQEVDSKEKVFYLSCRTCHSLTNFSDNLRSAGTADFSWRRSAAPCTNPSPPQPASGNNAESSQDNNSSG